MKRSYVKLTNGWYFIPIQKNGSTSVREHQEGTFRHRSRADFKGFTIAIIRHPCDRLVSCWLNRTVDFMNYGCKTWDDFIDYVVKTPDDNLDAHARSQAYLLDEMPDKLVKFEEMNEEFAKIGIVLKKKNASERGPWQDYFTQEQIDRVLERYKRDYELYVS